MDGYLKEQLDGKNTTHESILKALIAENEWSREYYVASLLEVINNDNNNNDDEYTILSHYKNPINFDEYPEIWEQKLVMSETNSLHTSLTDSLLPYDFGIRIGVVITAGVDINKYYGDSGHYETQGRDSSQYKKNVDRITRFEIMHILTNIIGSDSVRQKYSQRVCDIFVQKLFVDYFIVCCHLNDIAINWTVVTACICGINSVNGLTEGVKLLYDLVCKFVTTTTGVGSTLDNHVNILTARAEYVLLEGFYICLWIGKNKHTFTELCTALATNNRLQLILINACADMCQNINQTMSIVAWHAKYFIEWMMYITTPPLMRKLSRIYNPGSRLLALPSGKFMPVLMIGSLVGPGISKNGAGIFSEIIDDFTYLREIIISSGLITQFLLIITNRYADLMRNKATECYIAEHNHLLNRAQSQLYIIDPRRYTPDDIIEEIVKKVTRLKTYKIPEFSIGAYVTGLFTRTTTTECLELSQQYFTALMTDETYLLRDPINQYVQFIAMLTGVIRNTQHQKDTFNKILKSIDTRAYRGSILATYKNIDLAYNVDVQCILREKLFCIKYQQANLFAITELFADYYYNTNV